MATMVKAMEAALTPRDLLDDYSLEMTGKDIDALDEAADAIAPGTRISIAYLPNEDSASRVAAARAVRRLGFVPVPHISARRLKSQSELEVFLDALQTEAEVDRVFVVAGDPPRPEGPYEDALAVIRSGVLAGRGIGGIGISGYPEGHPDISDDKLWHALFAKHAALNELGLATTIVTQFGFDPDPVLNWLERVRQNGLHATVRVGVAGPASVKTLLRFAARCGVGASAKVMGKYGVSLTRLLGTAGPDPIIKDLAAALHAQVHGQVRLHFYPFGGLGKTARWVQDFCAAQGR